MTGVISWEYFIQKFGLAMQGTLEFDILLHKCKTNLCECEFFVTILCGDVHLFIIVREFCVSKAPKH